MYTLWWLTAMVHMVATTHEQEGTAVDSWQKDAWYNTIGSITNRPTTMTWVILIYSALGPGIVADLIQQKGQAMTTGATGSNLILCMESLFTAVLGRLLLGEETSWIEKLGGVCLVLGAWISGRQDDAAG
jgi:drug/metabolite transporter (DMT)-like permease